ncbi:cobyric acid synthase [Engelhardtia mirabilis]|uniref:Cobyric acid synthase n=1 Tax=Engelhardtia mirabilis TaxID=2528011 RepID=A0A518BDW2_9BACT|nr:Cobyric acid synthase [Planctomycetes bacterium Pla133]QDU99482.1 Cobyric acid synthase [Planctomycetes bacterium Pla86]
MNGPTRASTPLMVMGCTSDAGKSFLVTALCRHYANRGLRVAPFKAQNMSNNAAVTPTGEEIGRAQYLQALAARVTPDARMNPVLLKPSADTHAQVVVRGRYAPLVTGTPWMERRARLWPAVAECLAELTAQFDLVVIEGAGSPAEINLRRADIVNMAVAIEAEADVYLASDIDRGGSFAHLLGTYECLTEEERARIKGFVLNRFRGDPTLLGEAPAWLEERTGVPVVALVPYRRHTLPEEDALNRTGRPQAGAVNVALIVYPWASNLDEFDPLVFAEGVQVVPITRHSRLDHYDLVVLPGSKDSSASLAHLRVSGLDREIEAAARSGVRVLGVCGGMQILGRRIHDPEGLESGDCDGLGLLDLETTLVPAKRTEQVVARLVGEGPLAGTTVAGYEIHHGQTVPGPGVRPYLADGLGWSQGPVTGVYLHGLAENTAWRQDLLESLGWKGRAEDWATAVDAQIESIAGLVESSGWAAALDAR